MNFLSKNFHVYSFCRRTYIQPITDISPNVPQHLWKSRYNLLCEFISVGPLPSAPTKNNFDITPQNVSLRVKSCDAGCQAIWLYVPPPLDMLEKFTYPNLKRLHSSKFWGWSSTNLLEQHSLWHSTQRHILWALGPRVQNVQAQIKYPPDVWGIIRVAYVNANISS